MRRADHGRGTERGQEKSRERRQERARDREIERAEIKIPTQHTNAYTHAHIKLFARLHVFSPKFRNCERKKYKIGEADQQQPNKKNAIASMIFGRCWCYRCMSVRRMCASCMCACGWCVHAWACARYVCVCVFGVRFFGFATCMWETDGKKMLLHTEHEKKQQKHISPAHTSTYPFTPGLAFLTSHFY